MGVASNITFQKILAEAAGRGASDLHLTAGGYPSVRVSGEIETLKGEIITSDFLNEAVFSFLSETEKKKLEQNRQLTIAHTFEQNLRFRIDIFYQKGNLACSFRYIPSKIKTLRELGFPRKVEDLIQLKKGLILICGSYGSGRSTTLASFVQEVNSKLTRRIVTLEDPIEYQFISDRSIVAQREVGKDITSLAQGIKLTSKEDIDLVAVSQLKEQEAILELLRTVSGGRLAIAVLEGTDTARILEELVKFFPDNQEEEVQLLLAENLTALINQRLVKRIGGGMVLVTELLFSNPAIKTSIREGRFKQIPPIIQTSRQEGMIPLDRSLIELIRSGEIEEQDAIKEAVDPETLRAMLHRR